MNNKKKVFVVAVAVCLIAILSLSSLAWFSDADEVTNKFMIATSDDPADPDDIFSVDIFEQVEQDEDGAVGANGYDAAIGAFQDGGDFTYEHIIPGGQYDKKPWVRNLGAYDQWIRMKVTFTDAAAWAEICEKYDIELTSLLVGIDTTLWTLDDEVVTDQGNDTVTFTYYLERKLEPHNNGGKDAFLFTSVNVPTQLDQYDMAALEGGFELNLLAEAVQADNTGDTAQEAFALVMGD